MGSIESYETAAGKRYRVRYRKPDNSQAAKRGFLRKKDAEDYLAGVTVSKSTGVYVDPARAKITLREWLAIWQGGRADQAPTTRERTQGIIAKQILPLLGHYPLSQLDQETLQAWTAKLSTDGKLAPRSVRKVVNTLSGALEKAVPARIPRNPARGLKLPKAVTDKKRYLTHAQVAALSAALDEKKTPYGSGKIYGYGLLVKVMAYCGPRWGEVIGLRVSDVDFERGRLEIQHTIVEVKGNQIDSVPKGHKLRSVPVPPSILAQLKKHVEGKAADSPLFPGARGGWLRNRTFRRDWLSDATKKIGVAGFTPHELRHTAASLAISSGANVKAVQRMLGHASAAVTLDIYADLFDTDLDAVSIALDSAIAESIVSKPRPDEPELQD